MTPLFCVMLRHDLNKTFEHTSSYLAQQGEGPGVGGFFGGDGNREAGAGFYIHSF